MKKKVVIMLIGIVSCFISFLCGISVGEEKRQAELELRVNENLKYNYTEDDLKFIIFGEKQIRK